jgi:TetR/AcrR family transcriptional repressor of lmrAB and yxaGH operons
VNAIPSRSGSTREVLVEAAAELFRTQGISGSGIGAICQRAGVTKGVFSHHFPGGKSELVRAAVDRNTREVRMLITRLRDRTDGSTPALLRALFDAYAKLFARHGWAYGCPVAATAIESGLDPTLAEAAAAGFQTWRDCLRELDPTLDEPTAALIVAAVEGAILQARAQQDLAAFRQIGERLAEFLQVSQRG